MQESVRTRYRVLICHDRDDDTTLTVLRDYQADLGRLALVKNSGCGALGAVLSGFAASTAPAVLTMPADDTYNAPRLDRYMAELRKGRDVVVLSRFMPGGRMVGCPWLKALLCRAASWFLRHITGLPVRDATNGFRLFSRRVIEELPIETKAGFAWSLELLVKCHRLGWQIGELPAHWYERQSGRSRFRVFKWAPLYLRWVAYALATRFLRRGPETVTRRGRTVQKERRIHGHTA